MSDRHRVNKLTDIMARVLHYQDSGDPPSDMTYDEAYREFAELPRAIIQRYRNDARFHAQVERAVAMVLEVDGSSDQTKAEL